MGRGERECKGEVKGAESVRGASKCRIAIHHNEMQSNPIQYNTSECNTVQYSTVQYNASVCTNPKDSIGDNVQESSGKQTAR